MRDYFGQMHRLDTVAFRIRTANHADCKQWVAGQIGLMAGTPESLPKKYRAFSAEALQLRWVRATVYSVVDGSPAAVAGIVNGDELMSFNNDAVPVTGTAAWMRKYLRENRERTMRVTFKRDGEDRMVVVKPVLGCAIPLFLETNTTPDAYTDYEKIVVYSSILRLARTDAQLATVVGHELAHVNMGHYRKQLQNRLLGQVSGALLDGGFLLGGVYTGRAFTTYLGVVGANAFSVGFEREADYVGAYYAARAGYDVAGAEEIWIAFALENPNSLRIVTTHPTSPLRFLQMRKTAEEIADKQRRYLPLVPELKTSEADATQAPREDIH